MWGVVNQMRAGGSRAKYWVVSTENGDMVLKTENQLKDVDPDSVVGNLKDLYIKLVKPNEKADTSFFQNVEKNTIQELNRTNIAQENLNKPTFFK